MVLSKDNRAVAELYSELFSLVALLSKQYIYRTVSGERLFSFLLAKQGSVGPEYLVGRRSGGPRS